MADAAELERAVVDTALALRESRIATNRLHQHPLPTDAEVRQIGHLITDYPRRHRAFWDAVDELVKVRAATREAE